MNPTATVTVTINAHGCLRGDVIVKTCDKYLTIQVGRRYFWASRGFVTTFTKAAFCLTGNASPREARSALAEDGILTVRIPAKKGTAFTEEDRGQVVPVTWAIANKGGEYHVIPTTRTGKGERTENEPNSGPVVPAGNEAKPRNNGSTQAPPDPSRHESKSPGVELPETAVRTSDTVPCSEEPLEKHIWSTEPLHEIVLNCANGEPRSSERQCDELKVIDHDCIPTAPSSTASSTDSVGQLLTVPSVSTDTTTNEFEHPSRGEGIIERSTATGSCTVANDTHVSHNDRSQGALAEGGEDCKKELSLGPTSAALFTEDCAGAGNSGSASASTHDFQEQRRLLEATCAACYCNRLHRIHEELD